MYREILTNDPLKPYRNHGRQETFAELDIDWNVVDEMEFNPSASNTNNLIRDSDSFLEQDLAEGAFDDEMFCDQIRPKNLSIEDPTVELHVQARLESLGFKKSPTDPATPGDGNCFIHGLRDQLR